MGSRGPKPLPTNLHHLRGNASKKPLGELRDSVAPPVEIPGCPSYLLPIAKKYWKYITPLLYSEGLIAQLDRAALELVCQSYAWYVWHDTCLQRDVAAATKGRSAWEADPANAGKPWTGGDGFQVPTPNGSFTYSAHWVGRKSAAAEVDKYLANFGMSPSSRARVTPSSDYPFLPGMEPSKEPPAQSAKITSLKDFAAKSV